MTKGLGNDLLIGGVGIAFTGIMLYFIFSLDKEFSKENKIPAVTESIENFVTGRGNVSRKHSHKKNKTNRRK